MARFDGNLRGLSPAVDNLVEVEQQLLGFQRRYEQTAAPFAWRFTRSDLDRLLRRLEDKEQLTKAA